MRILFINNEGGGFADHLDVDNGTTVQQLFEKQIPYGKASNFLIRVNRQPTSSGQFLQDGDRVSITPTKIEGGCRTLYEALHPNSKLWHHSPA